DHPDVREAATSDLWRGRPHKSSSSLIQPINIKRERCSPLQRPPPRKQGRCQAPSIRCSVYSSSSTDLLLCMECCSSFSSFSSHFPSIVRCLLCRFSSCCSRAYALHMIHHHVPRSREKPLPLHRRPPPCVFVLQCSGCAFRPLSADLMADHLLKNPEHYSATCWREALTEPDLQFAQTEARLPAEAPLQNQDLMDPSWRSADCWKTPSDSQPSIASFSQCSGPHHCLSKTSDAVDYFLLMFPPALLDLITIETNAHIKTCHFLGCGLPDWVPVTTLEIKGFLGLVVLMGLQNLPDPAQFWSWSHYDNSYAFCRAMSFRRFQQISSSIRMGSFTTDRYRGTRTPKDPLHIFRPMLDLLGGAMWDAYQPNCCLSVDRALLPSLGGDSLAKGDPRTQPQVWLLCDSKSGFCHRLFIQVGAQGGPEPGFTVVPELVKGLEGRHHQLFLSSSLASVPLLQKLLDQGLYASCSFPPPSPILPPALWAQGLLERPGDFLQRQLGPVLATRWRDTKEMCCLSTNAAPAQQDLVLRRSQTRGGELDPITRPGAFRLLQENLRGVDICKQLLACNPLGGVPQDRHWRGLLWFLVNLSIVNAFLLLRESRRDCPPAWVKDGIFSQVTFRRHLGNQLAQCAPPNPRAGLPVCKSRRAEPQDAKENHRMVKISSISKRCRNCYPKNIRRESVFGCRVCRINLCSRPSCFWEFHELDPRTRGSTKTGFVKDRIR
ncbi:hypothetical protein KUCAC02_032766, partial [Chaenocephalus aceratus]